MAENPGQSAVTLLTTPLGKPHEAPVAPHPVAETKETVPMWDPDRGGIVDVPRNHAEHLIAVGYKFHDGSSPVTGEEAAQQEQSDAGLGEALNVGSRAFFNESLFGLPEYTRAATASKEENAKYVARKEKLEKLHPWASTVGSVAGFLNPLTGSLVTHGIEKLGLKATGKLLAKAGEAGVTHTLAQGAIKGAGRLASESVALGADAAARAAINEAEAEKKYDMPIDAERIWQASSDQFGWGLKTGAEFAVGFGALRGLRKGGSKLVDVAEQRWPTKEVNVKGPKEVGPLELKSKTIKWKQVGLSKGAVTREKTGGGYDAGTSYAKAKWDQDTLEQTTAKSNFENLDETRTSSKHSTPDTRKVKTSWNEPRPQEVSDDVGRTGKRETGIVFEKGLSQDDMLTAIKTKLDDIVKDNDFDKAASFETMEAEQVLSNLHAKKAETGFLDGSELDKLAKAKRDKVFWQAHLKKEYPRKEGVPGYQDWLDEYYNVQNNLHEEITAKEAKVDPRFKSRKVEETIEKGHSDSGTEKSHQKDYSSGLDQTSTRVKTTERKLDEERTKFHHPIAEKIETKYKDPDRKLYEQFEETRFAPSKISRKEKKFINPVPYKLHAPIMYAAGGLGWLTGGAFGATVAAGQAMAAGTVAAEALNNRAKVSQMFDKMTRPAIRGASSALKAYLRQDAANSETDHNPVDVDKYHLAVENTHKLANPETAKNKVTRHMEPVSHHYPTLTAHLIHKNIQASQALLPHIPQDTRAPSLRNTPFNPPRSQKVKFLKMYQAVTQPMEVMKNPSPAQMQVIEQHMPAHVTLFRHAVSGALVDSPHKISDARQRQLSVAMGTNFTSRQDPKYMQRLQMSAHIEEVQSQGAPSVNGSKSAKVSQDATNLFATPEQLNTLA